MIPLARKRLASMVEARVPASGVSELFVNGATSVVAAELSTTDVFLLMTVVAHPDSAMMEITKAVFVI